jgi:hypothetical protein
LQQQQKFIALAMATQREILDACMNDEPRQKLNEKKKTQVPPQNTIERQPKNKISRQGTKPSAARSSTEKTKTGQAQLRTYLPSGKTRTTPSTIITRLQQRRHDQQQQRQKLKQLVLH